MKNIGDLNQFSAAANLTLFDIFFRRKRKKSPFILCNKAIKELNKTTGK